MRQRILPWLVIAGFVVMVGWKVWSSRAVTLGPGMKAPIDPVQTKLEDPKKISMDEFMITPLAEFQIRAKVLSTKRYRWGKESKLSPVDLALGWGPMSDENILKSIKEPSRVCVHCGKRGTNVRLITGTCDPDSQIDRPH